MNMINGFNPIASLSFGAKNRGWRRLCLLFLLLLVSALPLKAAPVSEDSARTVAAHVLGVPPEQLVNRTASLPEDFRSAMYLFIPVSNEGFALISADDCALPVLGYSTTSAFHIALLGSGGSTTMKDWFLYNYVRQIGEIKGGGYRTTPYVAAQWEQWMNGVPVGTGTAIAPMLSTTWTQGGPYEQYTPLSGSSHCKASAAAIAMAQVMKYWNYPERGVGSVSYINNMGPRVEVSADFDTAYPWNDMPNKVSMSGSTESYAVSLLVYHAGAAIKTNYALGRSYPNTGFNNIVDALKNNFRYNSSSIRVIQFQNGRTSDDVWNAAVMDELVHSRPVIYIINYGAFVVDGCDERGLSHINWGRNGRNDGFYHVGSLSPENYYHGFPRRAIVGIVPLFRRDISAVANNEAWGSVSGGGTYWDNDTVTLEAVPMIGSRFRHWNNGSVFRTRRLLASRNLTDTAVFEFVGIADITVASNNDAWGSVSGGGSYTVGDSVVLAATAAFGYRFDHWSDGGTDNPRRFVAAENKNLTAFFVYSGTATVNAVADDAGRGSVSGGGTYSIGDRVTLTAKPVFGWIFGHWHDGNTDNPRRIVVAGNSTFTAHFVRPGLGDPQFHLVELDDRENHAWSYYSDPECLVRSLNPMDVRIRYFGYGQNTMYSSDALQPEGEPDVDVSPYMVGIGIDAPWKNTYVYHKTLERVNGEQAESMAAADGPSFYRLIPNPYSRRPTHGTGDTRWRGFYKWRLKTLSGGAVFRDTAMTQPVTVGTMLDAEDTVFFMPAAEYGMEVDFEAIWAAAALFRTVPELYNAPLGGFAEGANAYERNIVVHNCDTCHWSSSAAAPLPRHYTLTFVHPDGTDGAAPALLTELPTYNISGSGEVTHLLVNPSESVVNTLTVLGTALVPPADFAPPKSDVGEKLFTGEISPMNPFGTAVKYEYIRFSPHDTYVYHCFIHRDCGIQETDSTWMFVPHPGGLAEFVLDDTVRGFKVYSGDTLYASLRRTYRTGGYSLRGGQLVCGRMCLPEGDGQYFLNPWRCSALGGAGTNGDTLFTKDSLQKIQVRYRLESGKFPRGPHFGSGTIDNWALFSVDVVLGSDYDRSLGDNGKLLIGDTKTGSGLDLRNPRNLGTRMFNYVFKSGTYTGKYDGTAANEDPPVAYLGPWSSGVYQGATTVVVEGGYINGIAGGTDAVVDTSRNYIHKRIYLKGGYVPYAVWGAADYADARGDRRMVFTGGEVAGWIAGGCNGTRVWAGELIGSASIYFGGKAKLQHDTVDDAPYYHSHGGNLYGAGVGRPDALQMGTVRNSIIVVADSAYISRNVYGGGNYGYVNGRGTDIQILGGTVKGSVFGGANRAQGRRVAITMRGGHVHGNIYGGSNVKGNVKGPVTIRIEGGTVGTPGCHDTLGNVFGSGYGVAAIVDGNVQVIVGRADARRPHLNNPLVFGNVYGGGFNAPYTSTGKIFRVATLNGRVGKSVFGGGFGSSAFISGSTNVNVMGSTHVEGNVYGGGNMGKVAGNTLVVVGDDTGSYTITAISNDPSMGTVAGGGTHPANSDVHISATPASGHWFKQWNDGNTESQRYITVTRNATYTAEFEPSPNFTVTATSSDPARGTAAGGGTYLADQVVSISATPSIGHRFTRWSDGSTSNPRSITVRGDSTYIAEFEETPVVWVDMGLPSGLLWAASNLGADNPEEYGDYYAWGETTTKGRYYQDTYAYYDGSSRTYTKYNATDGLTTLLPEDDAATVAFGTNARIPTEAEWMELIANTVATGAILNGILGTRLTSTINGNSLFLPLAGNLSATTNSTTGTQGNYWSSSVHREDGANVKTLHTSQNFIRPSSNPILPSYPVSYDATGGLDIGRYISIANDTRCYGRPIRAVRNGN